MVCVTFHSMDSALKPSAAYVASTGCLAFSVTVLMYLFTSQKDNIVRQNLAERHAIANESPASMISSISTAAFIILTGKHPDKDSPPLPPGRFYEGQMKHN